MCVEMYYAVEKCQVVNDEIFSINFVTYVYKSKKTEDWNVKKVVVYLHKLEQLLSKELRK